MTFDIYRTNKVNNITISIHETYTFHIRIFQEGLAIVKNVKIKYNWKTKNTLLTPKII